MTSNTIITNNNDNNNNDNNSNEQEQQHNDVNQHQHQDSIITYICPYCFDDPSSHSFKYLGIYNSIYYMYTCPERATLYYDCESILQHYTGVLQNIQGLQWIWFFDATNFSHKHYFQVNVSIALAKLLSNPRYSNNLCCILIYNPTWHLELTLNMIKPFLSTSIKNKVTIITSIPRFLRNNSIFHS